MQSSYSKGKKNNRKKKSQIAKSVFDEHYLKVEDFKFRATFSFLGFNFLIIDNSHLTTHFKLRLKKL
jgi:hypothetical protein